MSLTARARLLTYLRQSGLSTARAEANLDAFAHELAEKIRNADYPAHATDGADYAADLIDPSADPVRPGEETT